MDGLPLMPNVLIEIFNWFLKRFIQILTRLRHVVLIFSEQV